MILLIYLVAAYWATNRTVFANRITIGGIGDVFLYKMCIATIFGIVLIPVAVVKSLILKR